MSNPVSWLKWNITGTVEDEPANCNTGEEESYFSCKRSGHVCASDEILPTDRPHYTNRVVLSLFYGYEEVLFQ